MKLSPDAPGVQAWSAELLSPADRSPSLSRGAGGQDSTRPSAGSGNVNAGRACRGEHESGASSDERLQTLISLFQPAPVDADAQAAREARRWAPEVIHALPPRKPVRKLSEALAAQPGDLQSPLEPQIDPREEAARAAERIIAEANAQAAEIIALAERQCAEAVEQSHREGAAAAHAGLQAELEAAAALLAQVGEWRDAMLAQSEPLVLAMIQDIARTLFGQGISLSQDVLQQTFDRALQHAGTLGDLQIFMHPEDALTIDPYWREYHASLSGHQVKIVPTEAISRGGCYVQGQLGSVDARVETQMRAILEALTPDSAEVSA